MVLGLVLLLPHQGSLQHLQAGSGARGEASLRTLCSQAWCGGLARLRLLLEVDLEEQGLFSLWMPFSPAWTAVGVCVEVEQS